MRCSITQAWHRPSLTSWVLYTFNTHMVGFQVKRLNLPFNCVFPPHPYLILNWVRKGSCEQIQRIRRSKASNGAEILCLVQLLCVRYSGVCEIIVWALCIPRDPPNHHVYGSYVYVCLLSPNGRSTFLDCAHYSKGVRDAPVLKLSAGGWTVCCWHPAIFVVSCQVQKSCTNRELSIHHPSHFSWFFMSSPLSIKMTLTYLHWGTLGSVFGFGSCP